jgi:D-inositol-3-phosphate glycosyltransferase
MVSFHTSPAALAGKGDAGGMNVYIREMGAAIAALGVAVDLYTRTAGPGAPSESLEPGLTLNRLPAGPARPLPKEELADLAGQFAAALAQAPRPNLVHSHYWLSGLAGLPAARAWGVPHVQSLHTVAALKNRLLAPGDTPEPPQRLAAERRLVAASDLVLAASAAERDAIEADIEADDAGARHSPAGATPIRVVAPGVDTSRFHPGPGPDPASLPPAARRAAGYLMMVGRVQPLKGQDLAVEALARIPAAIRPALIVTGAPSEAHLDYAAAVQDRVRQLGLDRDVVFLGPQQPDRLAALLRGGRAALMPSRSETYGMVAVEAAASGLPVIAAATTGLRHSVADGVSGLHVEGRDPRDWSDAIVRLATDRQLAARLARRGAQWARGRTWERAGRRLLEAYCAAVTGTVLV